MSEERRQHRRLGIHLPLEFYPVDGGPQHAQRTVTTNISTGGLYFELDLMEEALAPALRSLLNVEMTVPPGDGYFPYEGRVSSVAEVVRCRPLARPDRAGSESHPVVGVAARFRDPLKLAF